MAPDQSTIFLGAFGILAIAALIGFFVVVAVAVAVILIVLNKKKKARLAKIQQRQAELDAKLASGDITKEEYDKLKAEFLNCP